MCKYISFERVLSPTLGITSSLNLIYHSLSAELATDVTSTPRFSLLFLIHSLISHLWEISNIGKNSFPTVSIHSVNQNWMILVKTQPLGDWKDTGKGWI